MKSERKPRHKETGTLIGVRLQASPLAALDAYVASQPEPRPSRPEAIRALLSDSLADLGHFSDSNADTVLDTPESAAVADRYADADPNEAVMVTGVGPMTLHRAVRKRVDWRDHHGLGLVSVFRGADKEPTTFDMSDLGRLAEMERFRS